MERDNKSVYSEANKNLADFSWVEGELQKISDIKNENSPRFAKLDYWNQEKGFGFIYVDKDENPVEREAEGAKRVFVHANNVYGLSRGEKLEGVVMGLVFDDKKGPALKYGSTLEYWEKEEGEKNRSKNDRELNIVVNKVHEQNRELWKEKIGKKVQEKILEVQKPHYESAKQLCPDCKTEVGSGHSFGAGWKYECTNCDWTYYFHDTQRMRQISYPESEDGMRPAGYYDTLENVKDEEGTPPIIVPGQPNAAYEVRRLDYSDLVIRHRPSFCPSSMSREESFRFIKEYTHLADNFPEVPQESDPEALLNWGISATENIIKDFSEKMK